MGTFLRVVHSILVLAFHQDDAESMITSAGSRGKRSVWLIDYLIANLFT